jgi:hypothetical protein
MRGLPVLDASDTIRVRRWDAVVLGGALPGLVAAVVLGMRGARVLILEEEAAVSGFAGLREPFLYTGAGEEGVLGSCLREIGIPLIDRRRIVTETLAYQVVLPDARPEVGEATRTIEELVAWGLAKPDEAQALVRAICQAATAERDAMFESPVVRAARRRRLPARRGPKRALDAGFEVNASRTPPRARGLPAEVAAASPILARFLAAQIRVLSNLGSTLPPPEAQARLLGAPIEGIAELLEEKGGLRPLLRRRIEALYGEFRTIPSGLRLIAAANQPGVTTKTTRDVWVGRALVLNAPLQALAAAHGPDPVPDLLQSTPATHLRIDLHYVTRRAVLPEGMASRVIFVESEPGRGGDVDVVAVRVLPGAKDSGRADLVVSAVLPADHADVATTAARFTPILERLMPFSKGAIVRQCAPEPVWDSDALLADPAPGSGWPSDCELRRSSRPPVYALDRSGVAALGFEGDVLLGWRAGDAIATDLV